MRTLSGGGVIYRHKGRQLQILLRRTSSKVYKHDNFWHLPKGTNRKGENIEKTVKREMMEETGYDVVVEEKIGTLDSEFMRSNKKIFKSTSYFLCRPVGKYKFKSRFGYKVEIKWFEISKAKQIFNKRKGFEQEDKLIDNIKRKLI